MKNIFKYTLSFFLSVILLFSVVIPAFAANGKWIKSGEKWWYKHTDGTYTKNSWEKIDGKWYHFDKSGWMHTGFVELGEKKGKYVYNYTYYFGSDGAMKTGWKKIDGNWFYFENSGHMLVGYKTIDGKTYYLDYYKGMRTGWVKYKNFWYYFNGNGTLKTGWLKYKDKWYYLDTDDKDRDERYGEVGCMIAGRNRRVNGKNYLFNDNGTLNNGGWSKIDNRWYYVNADGTLKTGWLKYKDNWYYLSLYEMEMATIKDSDAGKNDFVLKGEMIAGHTLRINGAYYSFNKDGTLKTGWVKYKDAWYYTLEDGNAAIGWQTINGKRYYFSAEHFGDGPGETSGVFNKYQMLSDVVTVIDGKTYIFDGSGSLANGWVWLNGNRYFAQPDGTALKNGWYAIDGTTYYFDYDGKVYTGYLRYYYKEAGEWAFYFLDENGQIVKGWVSPEQSGFRYWVYFADDGRQQLGWVEHGEDRYFFDRNGYAFIGRHEIDGKIYFFDENGILRTEDCTVGTDDYAYDILFDSDGQMTQTRLTVKGKIKSVSIAVLNDSGYGYTVSTVKDEQSIEEFKDYIDGTVFTADNTIDATNESSEEYIIVVQFESSGSSVLRLQYRNSRLYNEYEMSAAKDSELITCLYDSGEIMNVAY